jgi:TetR/AcrR family transcriptional regulator
LARTRAKDYDDKRAAILRGAARAFADGGYERTSMATLAGACGVSKALLYHYYDSKDALLSDILRSHLGALVEVVEAVPEGPPEARLRALIAALLEAYRDADAEHRVQSDAMGSLPEEAQAKLRALQRRLVNAFANAVRAVNPELAGSPRLKPATMALFGMLNWFYMWWREGGPVSREDYADMVATLFLDGVRAVD